MSWWTRLFIFFACLNPVLAAACYRHFNTAMPLNYLPRVGTVPPEQLLDQHQILSLANVLVTP